jgi:kumamolisin
MPLPTYEACLASPAQSRRPISREDFASRYGADPADVGEVLKFAHSVDLRVEEMNAAGRTIKLTGTAGRINAAFAIELRKYESSEEAYRGHEGPVHVPVALEQIVICVLGLDNRRLGGRVSVFRSEHRPVKQSEGGDPPDTTFLTPPQVARLYDFPQGKLSDQIIGILELGGGYKPSDIQGFFDSLGGSIPVPRISEIDIDGATNSPGKSWSDDFEVTLDICVAGSTAPGVDLAVYFAPQTRQGWVDAVTRAVHPGPKDPIPSVLSTSCYISDGDDPARLQAAGLTRTDVEAMSAAFWDALVLGVPIVAACGDFGTDDLVGDGKAHIQYPASDPSVLSCGGTTIGNIQGASFDEVTWNDIFVFEGKSIHAVTGGGISDFFPLPPFQLAASVPVSINDGHRGRGVPDIAGNASPNSGYLMTVEGKTAPGCGTSAVAPLYAGLFAILIHHLGTPVPFFPYLLYSFGNNHQVFRDINDGVSNSLNGVPGYKAVVGWDACTGWGSIRGNALLGALQTVFQEGTKLGK